MTEAAEPAPATASSRIWTIPNILSFVRLGSVPVFIWLFVTAREEAAVILYMAGAWSDFFDGYIARHTGSVTELGKLLDPLADRIFILALAVALVVNGALPLWLAGAVIGRDVLVLGAWPLLQRGGQPRIQVNFTGKCATAALLIGLSSLAWSETSWRLRQIADELGVIVTIVGAVLYWIAAVLYVRALKERGGLGRTADQSGADSSVSVD